MQNIQRRLAFWGSALFAVGIFTGLWSAAALTGSVALKIPHLALAAHLNGLMGGLWMLAVAFTFPFLTYGEKQLKRLTVLTTVPCWANWLLTLIASILGEKGLSYTGSKGNDALAAGLQLTVVLPSLIAVLYWIRGFYCGPKQSPQS